MLRYSEQEYIRAHKDPNKPYYNHSFDRFVRKAYCSSCSRLIGKQHKYAVDDDKFRFDDSVMGDYTHCPYCGKKLYVNSEITEVINDIYKQLDCADEYAESENNSNVPSVWEIQNKHIRSRVDDLRDIIKTI